MTTTTTNRLDVIAQRQRTSRVRDLAFAILIAFVMVFQLTALRSAVAKTSQPAVTSTAQIAPAAPALDTGSASCSTTPVC